MQYYWKGEAKQSKKLTKLIEILQVTGQLQFSLKNQAGIIEEIRRRHPQAAVSLKLNHVVKSLTFGEHIAQQMIKKRFGNTEHTQFDMMDLVDDSLYQQDESMKDYFYFMKLVPHIFVDEIRAEQYASYSYSLNHNSKVSL